MPLSARTGPNSPRAKWLSASVLRLYNRPGLLQRHTLNRSYRAHRFHTSGRIAFRSSAAACHESTGPSILASSLAEIKRKEPIRLTGAEEMLLPVVFVKAVDAKYDQPVLGDPFSQSLLDRCDIDYSRSHFTRDSRYVKWVSTRARQFDLWCQVSRDI